jgi:hypothetical protein
MEISRPIKLKYNENNKLELKGGGKKNAIDINIIEINDEDENNIMNFLMKRKNNVLFNMGNGKNVCNNKNRLNNLLDDNKVYILKGNRYNEVPFLRMRNMGFRDGICSLENLVKVVLLSDDNSFNLSEMGKSKINDKEEEMVYKILGSNNLYEDSDGINLNLLDEIELDEEYNLMDDDEDIIYI